MSDPATTDENPRAVIGGNFPPITDTLREQLAILPDMLATNYKPLADETAAALAQANGLPVEVASADDVAKYATVAKAIKGVKTQIEPARKKEKQPYLDGGAAVDGFFTGLATRLEKALAVMSARTKRWQDAEDARIRREAEEKARAAREAERLALEAAAEADRMAREQRQRKEAERAAALKPAQEAAPAPAPASQGTVAQHVEAATIATDQAAGYGHDARVADKAANAKPADNVRVRAEGGAMATSQRFWNHEVIDLAKIPPDQLWPFISDQAKLVAIGAFVKAGNRDLEGVRIFEDTRPAWR